MVGTNLGRTGAVLRKGMECDCGDWKLIMEEARRLLYRLSRLARAWTLRNSQFIWQFIELKLNSPSFLFIDGIGFLSLLRTIQHQAAA